MGFVKSFWRKGMVQKAVVVLTTVFLLFVLFISRDTIQPFLLGIRKYFFIGLLFIAIAGIGLMLVRASLSWRKLIWSGLTFAVIGGVWYFLFPFGMYDYMKTYYVYKSINLQEIDELPLTQNERIHPYNNIITMAYESIAETEEISPPQLVRIDGKNQWTMAIQPAKEYLAQRMQNNTEELFSVSSTSPFPRFNEENRIAQTFSIGESLAFSRNSYNAVVQKFNPLQMFTHEPSELFYMKDDQGNWVQVISLIRWEGFFFPHPSFGGVMVLEAGEHDFKDYLERLLIGKGEYIAPEDMSNYRYLEGQNTLSESVSRLQAESLKFLAGFTDPLPWNMKSAVKIPELLNDQNQQPFVTDFMFHDVIDEAYNGLYHWFGLEPIGDERTSLSYSVFIPADGSNMVYYYNHGDKKEGYSGVSAMPAKVIESKKEYDWSVNRPVEFRPYVKDIGGKRRLFMLTTIVTMRNADSLDDSEKASTQFDGAATPDLALVDVLYKDVIWIDAKKPDTWESTIINQMSESWGIALDEPEIELVGVEIVD